MTDDERSRRFASLPFLAASYFALIASATPPGVPLRIECDRDLEFFLAAFRGTEPESAEQFREYRGRGRALLRAGYLRETDAGVVADLEKLPTKERIWVERARRIYGLAPEELWGSAPAPTPGEAP